MDEKLQNELNQLTNKKLQELLREKKLKVSGKKSELIQRILDSDKDKNKYNNKNENKNKDENKSLDKLKIDESQSDLDKINKVLDSNIFSWSDYLDNINLVPVFDENNYKKMLNTIPDKNERTKSLVNYLISIGPSSVPRSKIVTLETIEKLFKKGCNSDVTLVDTKNILICFKHSSYDFDIKKPIFVTQLGNQLNDISDFFHRDSRMECGGYNRISPANAWRKIDERALNGIIGTIWRICAKNQLTVSDYTAGTRLSSTVYMAAQFKVHVAVKIYKYFNAKNVIDFSMGWGDRLAGWFCANQGNEGIYYGCDPNINLHKDYDEQIKYYNKWSKNNTKLQVQHIQKPAEDIDWIFIKDNSIDLIFTSPPYSDTERYANGSECENLQSWKRYQTTLKWYNNFLGNVIKKLIPKLKVGGFLAINIIDPEKNKKREKVCDLLYRTCINEKLTYEGYIGMRMKQRPKAWKEDQKDKFMASIMVEPIWVFKK